MYASYSFLGRTLRKLKLSRACRIQWRLLVLQRAAFVAKAEMYIIKSFLGVLSAKKPRDGARGLFCIEAACAASTNPSSSFLRHTFLRLFPLGAIYRRR